MQAAEPEDLRGLKVKAILFHTQNRGDSIFMKRFRLFDSFGGTAVSFVVRFGRKWAP
jgi:hypothetical protein